MKPERNYAIWYDLPVCKFQDIDKIAIGKYPLPLDLSGNAKNPLSRIDPRFESNRKYTISETTLELLKSPKLDVWQFDSNELVALLEAIFETLGLVEEFKIDRSTLLHFLYKIRDRYNPNVHKPVLKS
jgi:hypothetical protein